MLCSYVALCGKNLDAQREKKKIEAPVCMDFEKSIDCNRRMPHHSVYREITSEIVEVNLRIRGYINLFS